MNGSVIVRSADCPQSAARGQPDALENTARPDLTAGCELGQLAVRRSLQRVAGEGKFRDGFATDEMILNDALQNFRRATVIPHAFGINHGNGAMHADAQAVGAGAEDERIRSDEV